MEPQLLARMDAWLEAHRDEFVRDICDMIAIKSVKGQALPGKPFGEGPARAVEHGLALGEKYGIETDNDGYYSVSFLLPGRRKEELAMLSHIDVVPEGTGWSYPPYEATCRDGHIIGRGAHDNKGPSVATLYVLRLLRALGVMPEHGLRAIWGANEETGMEDVRHYLTTHTPPVFTLVTDARFPLCYGEKGILTADLVADTAGSNLVEFSGGSAPNSVPEHAVMALRLPGQGQDANSEGMGGMPGGDVVTLKAAGIAAHAAEPERGVSAIRKLAQEATEKALVTGPAAKAIAWLADAFADCSGERMGIAFADELTGKTTVAGGQIRMEGTSLIQSVNIRYAFKQDPADLIANLKESAGRGGFRLENIKDNPPFFIPLDDPKVGILLDTARELLCPQLEPYTFGGGTHARVMPNAVPFGPTFPAPHYEPSRFGKPHGADEAVLVDRLLETVKIYAVALIRLDRFMAENP